MNRFTPSESVTRHRGGVRDEDGKFAAASTATLLALAVAPGGGSERAQKSRSGEDIDCTVFFPAGTDIVNGDELTVRGKRFRIIVNDWRIADTATGGIEVLCMRGQG